MSAMPVPDPAPCRLCAGETHRLFERTVLEKHRAGYDQCRVCGLTQTSEPTWLEEAYGDAILPMDTGILARNLASRGITGTFLHLSHVGDAPCYDYAGGYGIFTRLMRDAGFAFYHGDPYAENLFAKGFEWEKYKAAEGVPPFAVTAFEVLEHFVRPLEEFRKIAELGARFIVSSTELHEGNAPSADWYYVKSAQHVAFYRGDTLEILGRKAGYPFVVAGPFFQVFSRQPFPRWHWTAAQRFGSLFFPFIKRQRASLTFSDHEALRGRSGQV